ncbi:Cysteine and histidine-rich domain-containing protein RAR1 [Vitis vinifera]|uniref:Cysteine and histidine-rich domain-containing protein RAR1 n=1 Tax=Vitis vinifera TaxID=29760 RepID=A0A438JH20_VITVI|nr:Cysteine and histidine-rich domain-containing protein RAR1 [Vitis vinifera]
MANIICKTGKHTTEKLVLAKPAPPKNQVPAPAPAPDASSKQTCSRCQQGFFCSEHGTVVVCLLFILCMVHMGVS